MIGWSIRGNGNCGNGDGGVLVIINWTYRNWISSSVV